MSDYLEKLERDGFVVLEGRFLSSMIEALIEDITIALIKQNRIGAGIRNLLNLVPSVRELTTSEELRQPVEAVLGRNALIVRGVYFDKQKDSNWKVAWHQDLTIAVKKRVELKGCTAWSIKAGIQHVHAPDWILENMIAMRVHLDDADESNGCLRVIPGSHKYGRLTNEEILARRERTAQLSCAVQRGDVIMMRPLLLHASSVSIQPAHRRVIHLEYCGVRLPDGLEWYESGSQD